MSCYYNVAYVMYMWQWQSTHLEGTVVWVRVPPEAAHFSLEKRIVSSVVLYCVALFVVSYVVHVHELY